MKTAAEWTNPEYQQFFDCVRNDREKTMEFIRRIQEDAVNSRLQSITSDAQVRAKEIVGRLKYPCILDQHGKPFIPLEIAEEFNSSVNAAKAYNQGVIADILSAIPQAVPKERWDDTLRNWKAELREHPVYGVKTLRMSADGMPDFQIDDATQPIDVIRAVTLMMHWVNGRPVHSICFNDDRAARPKAGEFGKGEVMGAFEPGYFKGKSPTGEGG